MPTPPRHGFPWTGQEEQELKRAVDKVRPKTTGDTTAWKAVTATMGRQRTMVAYRAHWTLMRHETIGCPPGPTSFSSSGTAPRASDSSPLSDITPSSAEEDDGQKHFTPFKPPAHTASTDASSSEESATAPRKLKKKPAAPKPKWMNRFPPSPPKKDVRFDPSPCLSSSSPPLATQGRSRRYRRRRGGGRRTRVKKNGLPWGLAVAVGVAAFFAGTFFVRLVGIA